MLFVTLLWHVECLSLIIRVWLYIPMNPSVAVAGRISPSPKDVKYGCPVPSFTIATFSGTLYVLPDSTTCTRLVFIESIDLHVSHMCQFLCLFIIEDMAMTTFGMRDFPRSVTAMGMSLYGFMVTIPFWSCLGETLSPFRSC